MQISILILSSLQRAAFFPAPYVRAAIFSEEAARNDPSKWLISEFLQSMPVFVAFTCEEARVLFSEDQPTVSIQKGFELFPKLVSVNPGSLLLNPGYRFGGELYLNELKMLAKAAPRYRGMKF